jgi:hypothetical protein
MISNYYEGCQHSITTDEDTWNANAVIGPSWSAFHRHHLHQSSMRDKIKLIKVLEKREEIFISVLMNFVNQGQ